MTGAGEFSVGESIGRVHHHCHKQLRVKNQEPKNPAIDPKQSIERVQQVPDRIQPTGGPPRGPFSG